MAKTAPKKKEKTDYKVITKRSGRYAVLSNKGNKYLHGEEKIKILVKEGLIKAPGPGKKKEKQDAPPAPAPAQ